ncbi:AcvB/VirJ family lysyl-phosphatidylglycerol hydrolase [Asticcacaulis sp. 201]|uniref:AcvB/VirJ family lysyl-phosphatidylglycerol hydrolase n=1 Tax=Asticcacaulis sp. 201 TaxID=3028787 RepID=UPI0029165DB4|nr:AcvB/VirJ family lysyl-phosphatidylglycerol hydrolase [Asticcacaulis sp. 201]MDV6329870.1 AcvB/VirJ family lysyl-phosphatidylglycerol hydrolase [Asticcacaulis sp. 201]
MTLKRFSARIGLKPLVMGACLALAPLAAIVPVQAALAESQAVIPVSANRTSDTLILIWSGDGGWHSDLDVQLGKQFAALGYDVIGFDTNVWFSTQRTDAEVARQLSAMIDQHTQANGVNKVVLLGWSYGADVLPIAYDRLGIADQKTVAGVILLAVSKEIQLQVTLAERAGLDPGNIPVEPELARIPRNKLVCVYSSEEKGDTSCLTPAAAGSVVMELPGNHAFNHDAAEVARRLLPFIEQVTQKAPPPKA